MPDSDTLYPCISPYETGFLEVGNNHQIYWEQSGNPHGQAIVFLHGGPGSGSSPWQRQLFDPEKYRIILFDQRGAGKSTPHACLKENTTPDLVKDIEELRQHLKVDTWHVSGGSWGSTLALYYADKHPDKTNSLVIYGVFLCRKEELKDMYFDGGIVSKIFPDIFEEYLSILPEDQRDDPILGYRDLFLHKDKDIRYKATNTWTRLEKSVSALIVPEEALNTEMSNPDFILAHSLVENHYFINAGFIDGNALLKSLPQKLSSKNIHIIQGRYDMVCPFRTAWDLHKALPHSHLHIIDNAGHTAKELKTTRKLIEVFDLL